MDKQRHKLVVVESIYGHVACGGGHAPDSAFMDKEVKAFIKQ